MPQWLIDLLATLPTDAHWSTRRRMAYIDRCPSIRQQEALLDHANGDSTKLDAINADMAAIKAAIPKT